MEDQVESPMLSSLKAAYYTLESAAPASTPDDTKDGRPWVMSRWEKRSAAGPGGGGTCHLSHWASRPNGVRDISDGKRWRVACILRLSGGWQHRPSWAGIRPCHMQRRVPARPWARGEMQCLAMGHQANKHQELFSMSLVLSDPLSHNIEWAQ